MSDKELLKTTDAHTWAVEFHKLHPNVPVDTLIGWFSNAIMAGYDKGREDQRKQKS